MTATQLIATTEKLACAGGSNSYIESARRMHATGTVYLGAVKPQATTAADGTFNLTLQAVDCQGAHQSEGWLLTWAGADAQAWHRQHASQLTTGAALRITCSRIRSHNMGRFGRAEIHAQVLHCVLLSAPARPPTTATRPPIYRKTPCTS